MDRWKVGLKLGGGVGVHPCIWQVHETCLLAVTWLLWCLFDSFLILFLRELERQVLTKVDKKWLHCGGLCAQNRCRRPPQYQFKKVVNKTFSEWRRFLMLDGFGPTFVVSHFQCLKFMFLKEKQSRVWEKHCGFWILLFFVNLYWHVGVLLHEWFARVSLLTWVFLFNVGACRCFII